jgi:hypothetical protein
MIDVLLICVTRMETMMSALLGGIGSLPILASFVAHPS